MKVLVQLLRTTFVGGLLFLLPVVTLVIIIGKALAVAHKLVDPLAGYLPFESIIGLRTAMVLAIVVIVAFCFISGLFARTRLARRAVGTLEAAILSKIPGYAVLKSTGESLLGADSDAGYAVALVRFSDSWQIGLPIEELENGLVAVYIPSAPNPLTGAVHFMAAERIVPTGIPIAAGFKCLKRLGKGSNELLGGLGVDR